MTSRLSKLLSKARSRIAILQSASRSPHAQQIQNINIILARDKELCVATTEIVELSLRSEKAFESITDFLQEVDTGDLNEFERDLMASWLRKTVAQNHISYARRYYKEKDFFLLMLDTSFSDQPFLSWVAHPDFLKVVSVDGKIATELSKIGHPQRILRVFFVPTAEFIISCYDYVAKAIAIQAQFHITTCLSRADLAAKEDQALIGDCFCIPGRIACDIEKPVWRFVVHRKPEVVKAFEERIHTVAQAPYSVIITQKNLSKIDDIILELATV